MVKGIAAGLAGALGFRASADAQVSQAYCGNDACRTNPGKCKEGCVCCVWPNKNSRCMPPGLCGYQVLCAPGKVADPIRGCVDPCTGPQSCPQPAADSCKVATCSAGGLCGTSAAPNNSTCGANNICCGGTCVANTTVSNCRTCGTTCTGSTPICNATTGCVQCATAANCPPPNTSICQGAATCNAGVCEYGTAANNTSCGAGKTCCGGTCIANTTVTNCGTCGNACTTNQVCTSGTCTCPNVTCSGACCAAGQVCIGGVCSPRSPEGGNCDTGQNGDCQAGLTCCSGKCRNLQTNLDHCGTCGNDCDSATPGTCDGARTCSAGVCGFNPADQGTVCRPADASGCDVAEVCDGSTLLCPADAKVPTGQPGTCLSGQVCCGNACTQVGTLTNCETCGDICLANEVCTSVAAGCICPNEVCGSACCAANQVCISGVCSPRGGPGDTCDTTGANDCQTDLTCCSGFCRDLNNDPDFCGTCINECQDPNPNNCEGARICTGGTCGYNPALATTICRASTGACDPAEFCNGTTLGCPVDDRTDDDQTGTCPPNQVCCNEFCTELGTTANCESCGDACADNEICDPLDGCVCPNEVCGGVCCSTPTQVCIGGVCSPRGGPGDPCDTTGDNDCQQGLTCCSGFCRNLQTDLDYCGSCTEVCDNPDPNNCEGARICTEGICGFTPASDVTVCRPADASGCDVAELCDGETLGCPPDSKAANGAVCGTDQICCAGICCAADAFCSPGGICVECLTAETCDDSNPCTSDSCVSGTCVHTNLPSETECTTSGNVDGSCDGAGTCNPFFCTPGSAQACYTGPAGTLGVGVCAAGTETCNSAGSAYGPCVGQVLPSPEVCDGLDNDCDGVADDGIVGIGAPCSTGLLGICASGTTQCVQGTIVCQQLQQPQPEICNGLDDDCDGVVDDGATCPAGQSCITGSCVCTPETTSQTCTRQGRVCGSATNFCGGVVDCGPCPLGTTCNSAGACVANCVGEGVSCAAATCCGNLICNEFSVCEAPCDPDNPTANCLCGANSGVCPANAPCCITAGSSPRRCGDNNGQNCACADNDSCSQLAENRRVCCAGFCTNTCPG